MYNVERGSVMSDIAKPDASYIVINEYVMKLFLRRNDRRRNKKIKLRE